MKYTAKEYKEFIIAFSKDKNYSKRVYNKLDKDFIYNADLLNTESDDKRCLEIKKKEFQDIFNVESIYGNPSLLFLAYVLDSCGFTDHGSSIGGAWITDLGRMYLDVLNEVNFTD